MRRSVPLEPADGPGGPAARAADSRHDCPGCPAAALPGDRRGRTTGRRRTDQPVEGRRCQRRWNEAARCSSTSASRATDPPAKAMARWPSADIRRHHRWSSGEIAIAEGRRVVPRHQLRPQQHAAASQAIVAADRWKVAAAHSRIAAPCRATGGSRPHRRRRRRQRPTDVQPQSRCTTSRPESRSGPADESMRREPTARLPRPAPLVHRFDRLPDWPRSAIGAVFSAERVWGNLLLIAMMLAGLGLGGLFLPGFSRRDRCALEPSACCRRPASWPGRCR